MPISRLRLKKLREEYCRTDRDVTIEELVNEIDRLRKIISDEVVGRESWGKQSPCGQEFSRDYLHQNDDK